MNSEETSTVKYTNAIYADELDEWEDHDRMTAIKNEDKGLCVSCKSSNVMPVRSKGHNRCNDCGTCFGQILDDGADWGIYDDINSTEVARCGFVTSHYFPKSSMRTSTACGKNRSLQIIGRNDQMPYDEYALLDIFDTISNRCLKNRLTRAIIENTKLIYNEIHKQRIIIRGRNNRYGMYGACTFQGARIQNSYRSIKEIAQIYDVRESDITTACNKLQKLLIENPLLSSLPPTSPLDFIDRYCYILQFNKEQIQVIRKIIRNNAKLYLTSNHQPMSIATSCVLLYMNMFNVMQPTKKQVLDTFNITSVTSDKIYNKMYPFRNVIIDDDVTEMVYQEFKESKFIAVSAELPEALEDDMTKLRNELYEQNKEIFTFEEENREKYQKIKSFMTGSFAKMDAIKNTGSVFDKAKQYANMYKNK